MLGWFRKKKKKEPGEITPPVEMGEAAEESNHSGPSARPAETETATDEGAENILPETQAVAEEPAGRKGLFTRLRERLAKTRDTLVTRIDSLFLGRKVIDPELFDELEEILITADLGVGTTMDLLETVRSQVKRDELTDPQALKKAVMDRLLFYLHDMESQSDLVIPDSEPFVVMVVGVNGVGKTTTIGKLAHKFTQAGRKVLLVAGDTFRAAAIEQLNIWADRIGVDIVARESGADPSSVIFDALDYAGSRDFDVIIIDTAGRLHTKVNLMEELKKIKRVINKKIPGAPQEVMLVLDATTGQNSISQTKIFNEAVGVTGLALTKLDGTAKGGIVVNISHEFSIPIRFIGIGEQMEDLRDFDPKDFVAALFAGSEAGEGQSGD